MSPLKNWTMGAAMLLALVGAVNAETTVSQSNDPTAAIGVNIETLLGQERAALDGLTASRLNDIVSPPERPADLGKVRIRYDRNWIASLPAPDPSDEQLECLAQALYFEARGEGVKGQVAVAEVILNRVDSPRFPSTICGVVNQKNSRGCQFSFTCDGRPEKVGNASAWELARKIAKLMIDGAPRQLTDGATYFHTPAVSPSWAKRFHRTAQIGRHIFYRRSLRTAMN